MGKRRDKPAIVYRNADETDCAVYNAYGEVLYQGDRKGFEKWFGDQSLSVPVFENHGMAGRKIKGKK